MNSGKELEQLVHEIERSLLSSDFKVTVNKTQFDDAGNQLAEFDIVISGRLGSCLVEWLIECRDRPSQGSAPNAWIEQLVARKKRFNFDKVIAVSTTGFAKGLSEYAEREEVLLRSVQRLRDIASDFNIEEMTYFANRVTIGPTNMRVSNPGLVGIDILNGAKFKLVGESDYQRFPDFVLSHLDDFNELNIAGDTSFRFEFSCEVPVAIAIDDRQFQVSGITLPLQLDVFVYEGRTLSANIYSEGEEMIGRDITYVFELPGGKFTQRVLFLNNFDGTQRMKLFAPQNLPDGFTVNFCQLYTIT